MPHVIQPATTARAKCRGCGEKIAAGELRFGASLPNPFADGETTHWFHLECAAFKRPEPFLETVEASTEALPDADRLIVGSGQYGNVELSPEAAAYVERRKCRVVLLPTREVIDVWNDTEGKAIGLFHVTC